MKQNPQAPKTEQINFRITPDLLDRLRKEAYLQRKTMTRIIEEAIKARFAMKKDAG